MAGQTVRIVQRALFTQSNLGASKAASVVVARKIDTSRWREGIVLGRLHSATLWANTASVAVSWALDGYTDEDPAQDWIAAQTNLFTFTEGTDTTPSVKNGALAAPFGPMIQIVVTFTQGSVALANFVPVISLDLNLKGE